MATVQPAPEHRWPKESAVDAVGLAASANYLAFDIDIVFGVRYLFSASAVMNFSGDVFTMSIELHFSRRERQIMDVVFAREEATVRQIQAELPDPPTDMAVRRLLQILEEKGHLRRRMEGREVSGPQEWIAIRIGGDILRHEVADRDREQFPLEYEAWKAGRATPGTPLSLLVSEAPTVVLILVQRGRIARRYTNHPNRSEPFVEQGRIS